jgi:mRNA-degrading endonuclease RelE of RelBE toxin-antitoxin system
MTEFQVTLTDHAISDLESISQNHLGKIHSDLITLKSNPFPSAKRVKRLKGFRPPVYRLRSGNFRFLYNIHENIVTVLRVIDRKILERVIRRLRL